MGKHHVFYSLQIVVILLEWPKIRATLEAEVKLKKDLGENPCGRVFMLGPSKEVRIQADGFVPNGSCGVTAYTPKYANNYTCDSLCVTFKTASIETCRVKVKFTGHKFRKEGDLVKEFSCHHRDKSAFCWDVTSMRVEVIEDYDYAFASKKPLYEFDVDVSARCTKDSVIDQASHEMKSKLAADERQTYIEGIAVGISLACLFLIVLFVAWCYTKHQAVSGGHCDNGRRSAKHCCSSANKKGSIIKTFRKKLNFKAKDPETSEESNAIYRKADYSGEPQLEASRDPETATKLSPLQNDINNESFEMACKTSVHSEHEKSVAKNDEQELANDGNSDNFTHALEVPEVVIVPGTPEPPEYSND